MRQNQSRTRRGPSGSVFARRQRLLVDALESRQMLAASKVVFTSSAATANAGSVISSITVQLQNANNGVDVAAAGGQTIALSTSSNGGTFLDGSSNPISSIVVPAGASTATFNYVDTVAASPLLTASAPNLITAAQQTETINANAPTHLAFTTNASGSLQGTSSTPIIVTLLDANDNVAVAPSGGTVVSLLSTSAGGTFSTTGTTTVAAGASTATFTYKDTIVGSPTITASAALGSVAQQQKVYSSTTVAVKPDPAGLGSYASTPPGGANAPFVYGYNVDWINRPANSPLPTNDWWTLILKSGFAGSLYSMPQKLFTANYGVNVSGYTGINSVANNIGYAGEQAITVGGAGTTFTRDALVSYGDWSLKFRMEKAANQYVDVTAVQGSPIGWYEYTNVSPLLTLGTAGSYGNISDGAGTSLGNGGNGFTVDHFRFTKAGVTFGVFAPAGTTFVPVTGGFSVAFSGAAHYLAIATLPDTTNATFQNFYDHAYSIPRNTTYGYSYSATAGAVTTTWDVTTEALKAGASTDILQGWLPTNYRDIVSGPTIVSGITYPTIYGTIRTSLGHNFSIVQPATGLNFTLPAPQATGAANDFDSAKMAGWLNSWNLGGGSDSYGGQTTLSQAAQMTLMAKQLGNANYTRLLNILRDAVTNWLTYSTGDNRYYTAYPKDGGLVAYPTAFGSDHYTDLHFHLGYLTSSAAVLAMLDPTWATNYGGIATLVAKSYANWDRSDTSEPYLRTFSPWKGHSYADGLGDSLGNQGNNQESVSEAVQSWQGLVLLGSVLNNQQMLDAGMMGYVMESKAELEYWLNVAHQDLNPPGYPVNRNTAINADFVRQQQTFFGNQPKYQLGIEGIPDWPSMDFLGKYNSAMQAEIDATLAAISTTDPYAALGATDDGNNWLSVILGIQGQVNPQKAADQFGRLLTLNSGDNGDPNTGIPYYNTYSNRSTGLRDFNYRLSVPVGGVYTNATTGKKTYVAYNSLATPQVISVYNAAGVVVDTFTAAPRTTTIFSPFTTLVGGVLTLNGTPAGDSFTLTQIGTTITAALGSASQTFNSATLTSILVNGLGDYDTLDFSNVTVPTTFAGGADYDTLNVNAGTFTFNADARATSDHLAVNVAAGANVVFNATQHLDGLGVTGTATLTAGGGNRLLVVDSIGFAGSGRLNLADHALVVNYTGGSPVNAVRTALTNGYAGGAWTGNGIFSSAVAGQAGTTLGYAEASELATVPSIFSSEPIDSTTLLVRFTLAGDGNLDGRVNFDDLIALAQNYNTQNKSFAQGNFDYTANGTVNFDDLILLAQNYNKILATVTLPPATATKAKPAGRVATSVIS